jgi:hypothetical protein
VFSVIKSSSELKMNASISVKSKARSSNFTMGEKDLLLQLALKRKDILECKRTNAVTWHEKNEAWRKIAEDFCASTVGPVSS